MDDADMEVRDSTNCARPASALRSQRIPIICITPARQRRRACLCAIMLSQHYKPQP